MSWVSWSKMTQPKTYGGLGFLDFQSYNDAFLTKLSWRIIHKLMCLMSRVLLGKYCTDSSFLQVQNRAVESHGWKSVLIGRGLIMSNSGWAVGNGEAINAWSDPWLSLSEQRRPMGPAPEDQSELTVAQLLLPDGSDWNREAIQRYFPFEEESILLIKPSRTGAADKLIWLGNDSGEYTTKSGYHTALSNSQPPLTTHQENFDWYGGIWKMNVAPKIRVFLWKIFQGALPVGERLATRNLPVVTTCKCCNQTESITHLFLHCEFAHKVWNLPPFADSIDSRGMADLDSVWPALCGLSCLPPAGIVTGPLAPWILWSFWIARNKLIFKNKASSPEDVLSTAILMAREWLTEQSRASSVQVSTTLSPQIELPNTAVLKTDAACRGDRRLAGLAWTLEENGHQTTRMAHCHYVASPLVAEGLALREAINFSITRGIFRIQFFSDSLQLINALTKDNPSAELHGITSDIKSLSLNFEFFIAWIHRSKNKEADALAKQAFFVESVVLNLVS